MKTNEDDVIFGISLKVTLAILLAIISLILILSHIFIPKIRSEITFATAVVGGAAVVYAAYYAGLSAKLVTKQGKQHAAFQVLEALTSPEMMLIRLRIENEISEKNVSVAPEKLYETIIADEKLLGGIRTLLGLFEKISVGIRLGYLDEDVLYYTLGFLLPFHFESLQHYIDQRRTHDKEPHLYWEVEQLRNAWGSHTSLRTGKAYTWPT